MKVPTISINSITDGTMTLGATETLFGSIPVLIEGVVSKWPAASRWKLEYLVERFGEATVTCLVSDSGDTTFLQQVNTSRNCSLKEALVNIFQSDTSGERYHLRIEPGQQLWDDLSVDFEIPDFLDGYNPSATGIWLGRSGNKTPFHHDWWHSLLAQVRGRKRYLIVNPFDVKSLQESWPSRARFEISPAPDIKRGDPSLDKVEIYFDGVLSPGQILYIPPYWFHQIDTIDNGNISMPLRFDTPQLPDVDLFQLSQESTLRTITNQPVRDVETIADSLAKNRKLFIEREARFVKEIALVRELSEEDIFSAIERLLGTKQAI